MSYHDDGNIVVYVSLNVKIRGRAIIEGHRKAEDTISTKEINDTRDKCPSTDVERGTGVMNAEMDGDAMNRRCERMTRLLMS